MKVPKFIGDWLGGLRITLGYWQGEGVTLNYPFEKGPLSKGFRGRHYLSMYESGVTRCIACKLCERVCPARAIRIDGSVYREDGKIYIDQRSVSRYEIDYGKCIYCGLCEKVCPVGAIREGRYQEITQETRSEQRENVRNLIQRGRKEATSHLA